jgi:hypothetical protein
MVVSVDVPKRIYIGLLVLLLNTFFSAPLHSCTCYLNDQNIPESKQVQDAFRGAKAVFHGTVKSVDRIYHESESNRSEERRITFVVHKSWKLAKDLIIVWTGAGRGDCGYDFKQDTEYLVYAYGSPSRLATSICTRTGIFKFSQEDIKLLGEPFWTRAKRDTE